MKFSTAFGVLTLWTSVAPALFVAGKSAAGTSGIAEVEAMVEEGKQTVKNFFAAVEQDHIAFDERKAAEVAQHQLEITRVMDNAKEQMILAEAACTKFSLDQLPDAAQLCESGKNAVRQKETVALANVEKVFTAKFEELAAQRNEAFVKWELDGHAIVFTLEKNRQYIQNLAGTMDGGKVKKALQQDSADLNDLCQKVKNVLFSGLTLESVKYNAVTITEVCLEILYAKNDFSKKESAEFETRFIAALELSLANAVGVDAKILYVNIVAHFTESIRRMLRELAENTRRSLTTRTLRMKASAAYTCGCDDGSEALQSDVVRRDLLDATKESDILGAILDEDSVKRLLPQSRMDLWWKEFISILITSIEAMFDYYVEVYVYPRCESLNQPTEWGFMNEATADDDE